MQKSLLRIVVLTVIASFGLISCSYTEDRTSDLPTQVSESANWTVLFYGAGNTDSDMSESGESNVLAALASM